MFVHNIDMLERDMDGMLKIATCSDIILICLSVTPMECSKSLMFLHNVDMFEHDIEGILKTSGFPKKS